MVDLSLVIAAITFNHLERTRIVANGTNPSSRPAPLFPSFQKPYPFPWPQHLPLVSFLVSNCISFLPRLPSNCRVTGQHWRGVVRIDGMLSLLIGFWANGSRGVSSSGSFG